MPLGLIVVWAHGCVGIHFWLRPKPWWGEVRKVAFVLALLLPTLALAGYVASGVEATRQALDPAWIQQVLSQVNFDPSRADEGANPNFIVSAILAILLAAVFAGRWVRAVIASRKPKYHVHYRDFRDNRILDARPGETVLETLRAAGIAHASVCGGRGRCSTCRVKVGEGARRLHPRTAQEEKVIQRIEAPPSVRLACQIRPEFDVEITPLLPASAGAEAGYTKAANVQGREINVAIVFIDLRDSTKLCEDRLPYDVLFILNQFFAEMAETLTETGGHYAQFNGDGLMALYGLKGGIKDACYQAIEGATAMFQRLEILTCN